MSLKHRLIIGSAGLLFCILLAPFSFVVADDYVPADEDYNASNTVIYDADDTGGNIRLQFGNTLSEYLEWSSANLRFDLSDDLRIDGNIELSGGINPGFTQGSIVFVGASVLTEDNTNFFWDDTNNRLGIKDNTPAATLSINKTSTDTDDGIRIDNDADTNALTIWQSGDVGNGISSDGAVYINGDAPGTALNVYTRRNAATAAMPLVTFTEDNASDQNVLNISNSGTGDSFRVDDSGSDTTPFIIDAAGNVGINNATPNHTLDIEANGTVFEIGDSTANDIIINFDDGTDHNLGWDDNYSTNHTTGTFSTYDNELAFRTIQSSNPPQTCDATYAGMQWMDTDTGIVYVCDTSNSRNKWLSTSEMVMFGDESGTCNAGANANSNTNCNVDWGNGLGPDGSTDLGFYIPQDITVTGYGFSEDNDACTSGSFDVEIWSTGSNADDNNYTFEADLATGLTGQAHNSGSLNVDIAGDQYTLWGLDNNCGQGIDDWNVVIYYRYRHD